MWAVLLLAALPLAAREKDASQYGMGLVVNLPFPESDVAEVVQEVALNGIIRGTKEYNKDEYLTGAAAANSTKVFPEWTEGGKVFYKVRLKALNPRNFKDSNDLGTLAVRYVVQAQDGTHTVLHIDAIFVEDFRHTSHASNGSVEGAEYKDIHDRLDSLQFTRAQAAEAEKEKREQLSPSQTAAASSEPTSLATKDAAQTLATAGSVESSPETLEQQVHDLRQKAQQVVKSPGAALKSAPFHTASTLQSLPAGTEVLIEISTTYWLGVETHEGRHGWILRDELELLP